MEVIFLFVYWCIFIAAVMPGGVRNTIAKHHGRYSKSDHLCQDGVEWTSRLRREYFVNYAVDIYDFALNLFRKLLKKKVCPILRQKTVSFRW